MLEKFSRYRLAIILVLILGLATFLRFWNLGTLPYVLHDDEICNTYIGRFILENGRDLNGQVWPVLYSDKFGDFPPVLPMYLSGAATYLFGVNAWASRVPFAILGVLSVGLLFFLTKWLFKSPKIASLAALFLAVCPWHVILSRASAEGIAGSFIFMSGLFLLFKAVARPKITWIFLPAYLLLLASYLFYPSFRVVTPLFLLPTFLLTSNQKMKVLLIVMAVFALSLTFGISKTEWGSGRLAQLSILSESGAAAGKAINYSLALGPDQVWRARIFNNKYVLAGREFLRAYTVYFSPQYLIGEGWIQPGRYNLVEHGVADWLLVLVLGGAVVLQFWWPASSKQLAALFQTGRARFFLILIWLMLVAPVPSAVTAEEIPNIHRTVVMVFGWAILFAVAVQLVIKADLGKYWRKIATVVLALILSIEVIYFWHAYTSLDYESSMVHREEGKSLLAQWLIANRADYDQIFIPAIGGIIRDYLFYQEDFSAAYIGQIKQDFMVEKFENFQTKDNYLCAAAAAAKLAQPEQKIIVAETEQCKEKGFEFELVAEIVRKNLSVAYYIQEVSFAE